MQLPFRSRHEHAFQALEAFEAAAGAEDDALEGCVDEMNGEIRLGADAVTESAQERTTTDEMHASDQVRVAYLGDAMPVAVGAPDEALSADQPPPTTTRRSC